MSALIATRSVAPDGIVVGPAQSATGGVTGTEIGGAVGAGVVGVAVVGAGAVVLCAAVVVGATVVVDNAVDADVAPEELSLPLHPASANPTETASAVMTAPVRAPIIRAPSEPAIRARILARRRSHSREHRCRS